ncbi:MAG: aldo/keto reductase [Firmicutes bacterium]|nr:aldo/keto reductase [Bacillota bacterium]
MLKREYGKTGEMLSIIGFGGIVVARMDQTAANNLVAQAIDRGVNYFDVAPTYDDAEDRLGPALVGKRDEVFLACKTTMRTRKEAERELHQSLRKLKTDRFDLYQLHAMNTKADIETAMGPGGVLEAVLAAKDEGLIRYVGFSSHTVEAAMTLMDSYHFDSVLFPFNWAGFFNADFGPQVLEKATEKGMAKLALKAMAHTLWEEGEERAYAKTWYKPIEDRRLASLALRFTLSQSITAAIPPGEPQFFQMALDIVENYEPIAEDEIQELRELAEGVTPVFSEHSA